MGFGPNDYTSQLQGANNLVNSFNNGLTAGNNLVTSQLQQQQMQMQLNQARMMQSDLQNVYQNPTTQGIAQLAIKYPQLASNFKQSFDMMTTAQAQDTLNKAWPVYAMVHAGNIDGAISMLQANKDAYINGGQPDKAAGVQAQIDMLKTNPSQAKMVMGLGLAAASGPENFAKTMGDISANERATELQPAAVKSANAAASTAETAAANAPTNQALSQAKTAAETAAIPAKLGIDRDTLATNTSLKLQEIQAKYGQNGELSPEVAKIVNPAAQSSVTADAMAKRFSDMATQFQNSSGNTGLTGEAAENWKALWGNQDQISALKQEYARIRSQGLAANLPPQVKRLTDSDLKVFGQGIPDVNSNPDVIAAFLRSMANVKESEAITQDGTSKWAAANRSLGPARSDMTIDGMQIAKGTSFKDFSSKYLSQQMAGYLQQQVNSKVGNRAYSAYLNPAAPAQPVVQPNNGTTSPGSP